MSKPREAYSVETFDCLNCNNVHIFLKDERDLVFATRTGGALDAANVRREFKAACRVAGIGGHWTPRELRHSFVSMLSADGVATEDIAHLVGHSSTRTTERVYRHELRPVLRTGAERMGRIFGQRS